MNKALPVLFRALLIQILIIYSTTLTAQQPALFFQNYTTVNGLCDNSINCITEDSRGFIWIGTAEGLSRFDGISFRNFYASRDSTRSFPNYSISNITEFKPHHLIFTSLGKLWCLNTITNTFYQSPPTLSNRYFSLIRLFKDGNLLLSSPDTIFITDQHLNITKKIPTPKSRSIHVAYPVADDTLLMTNNRIHFFYSISSGKFLPFVTKAKFKEVENISLYLGKGKNSNTHYFSNFWQGLYQYSSDGSVINHYESMGDDKRKRISHHGVNAMFQVNDTTVFLGSSYGLNVLNTVTGIVNKYYYQPDNDNSIAGNILTSIFRDRAGNIWIGTTEGLSKIGSAHNIEIISKVKDQELNYEFIRISKGSGPFIYLSSLGGGTYRVNRFTNSIQRLDSTIISNAWSVLDKGELVYFAGGGRKKLLAYNKNNGQITTPHFLDPYYGNADIVTLTYRDSHGDEWYSINEGGGLVRKLRDGTIEHYSRRLPTPSFSHSYLANATEDIYGNSWFGLNKSSTLLQWDYSKEQFHEMLPDTVPGIKGISFGGLFCMYADKKGYLWVSYEGTGLFSYDIAKHKARVYSIEDGLPTNYIYSITADDQQRLWLGTEKGLVCYLPEENKFITFKKGNGLPADEFGAPSGYFDPETNSLWITSKTRILRINPDILLQQTRNNFTLYTDEISVNGKMLNTYNNSSFSHRENNFQFQFTAVDIDNGKDLEFSYQLVGADENWIYVGDKRSAIYSSLGPGEYTFMIKARRKGDTEWIEIKDPYSFTIETPWWNTWWFRILIACGFIAVVILIVRSFFKRRLAKQRAMLEKQQAVEKERTRIATDMHDDFGASLSRIKFLSEKIQLEKDDPEKTNQDLGKISAFSDEMAEKMGEIVWALNQRYDSSGDMISFCRSYASEYLGDKNIKLHFESDEAADVKVNGEIRRNVFLVVKESLHNIVKHAKASEVNIMIISKKDLRIVIQDNGKGFDATAVRPFADGIENMKKRIKGIGGEFTIQNQNGTRIEIQVDPGIQQNAYRK